MEFNLYQLISIAADLKWIRPEEIKVDVRKTTLKELLHTARNTRNLIHPGGLGHGRGP